MPFDVKFEDESIPKGQVVHVDGLGELVNGETRQVSDEENAQFMARNQVVDTPVTKSGNMQVKTKDGPSVVEAFKRDPRFTVIKVAKTTEKTQANGEGNK